MTTLPPTVRPPFDEELVPQLEAMTSFMPKLLADSLPQMRQMMVDGIPDLPEPDLTAGGAVVVEEITVPGLHGAPEVPALILRPSNGAAIAPAVLYAHGGGMVLGSARLGPDVLFLERVARGELVVVSVDYRLAPEHPHPAPVEDCYAALRWLSEHATEIGADPDRLIICGMSAGGGLAAGTALMARDLGGPALTHQILICPMLDDRMTTHSSQMLLDEGGWDRESNEFGWTALLGEKRGGDDVSPYAAPARAEDLSGLPRTYIDCGSVETFRDEILDYARRLSEAGVSVDLHMWGGGFHGFEGVVPDAALARASRWVREEFTARALA
ncbi:alpha/beta hydrolase [Microbacterium sp. LWH3-1.2]|uniref:alpha/beta hydrolase n=1 Tax=Microbacterium sp. LWH3-1.2 TaxID=3135256 RepID=UPI0034204B36